MRNAGKIITVAAVAAALAACSPPSEQPSDLPPGSEPTPTQAQPPQSSQPGSAPAENEQACTAEDIEVTQSDSGEGYEVTIPEECTAPTELSYRELSPGSGQAVGKGDQVDLDYSIVSWADGQTKENSFGELGTLAVDLGEQQPAFEGWDKALDGAKEGSRRVVVVPADLGFAEDGGSDLVGQPLVVIAEVVEISPGQ